MAARIAMASVALVFAVAGPWGCSRRSEETSTTHLTAANIGCPLGVPGAVVDIVDVPGGADVLLTAPPWQLADLRRHLAPIASLYGPNARRGQGHDGEHLDDRGHGLQLAELPALTATVEDIDGGSRLHLLAEDPTQAEKLRDRLQKRAIELRGMPCNDADVR
jgi:hypothetical protein